MNDLLIRTSKVLLFIFSFKQNYNFKILIKALDCLREGEEIPNPYSFSLSHTSKTTKSSDIVPDLQNTMYAFIDGYPCVRLMNLSGTISCSSESPRSLILSLSSINLRVLRINCKLNIWTIMSFSLLLL